MCSKFNVEFVIIVNTILALLNQGRYQIFIPVGFYRSVKTIKFCQRTIQNSPKNDKALSWNYYVMNDRTESVFKRKGNNINTGLFCYNVMVRVHRSSTQKYGVCRIAISFAKYVLHMITEFILQMYENVTKNTNILQIASKGSKVSQNPLLHIRYIHVLYIAEACYNDVCFRF